MAWQTVGWGWDMYKPQKQQRARKNFAICFWAADKAMQVYCSREIFRNLKHSSLGTLKPVCKNNCTTSHRYILSLLGWATGNAHCLFVTHTQFCSSHTRNHFRWHHKGLPLWHHKATPPPFKFWECDSDLATQLININSLFYVLR